MPPFPLPWQAGDWHGRLVADMADWRLTWQVDMTGRELIRQDGCSRVRVAANMAGCYDKMVAVMAGAGSWHGMVARCQCDGKIWGAMLKCAVLGPWLRGAGRGYLTTHTKLILAFFFMRIKRVSPSHVHATMQHFIFVVSFHSKYYQ